jgi:hypothetical protein
LASRFAPRHCGQSWANTALAQIRTAQHTNTANFLFIVNTSIFAES